MPKSFLFTNKRYNNDSTALSAEGKGMNIHKNIDFGLLVFIY